MLCAIVSKTSVKLWFGLDLEELDTSIDRLSIEVNAFYKHLDSATREENLEPIAVFSDIIVWVSFKKILI